MDREKSSGGHTSDEDPNKSYLLYQTLVGAWPIEPSRIDKYIEKAMREAKLHTNWIEPDEAHERRTRDFCHSLYDNVEWRAELKPFTKPDRRRSRAGSTLGMTLLKLTVPGVPDIYQGDEAEYLALVDPDNRRRADWNELPSARLHPGATRSKS